MTPTHCKALSPASSNAILPGMNPYLLESIVSMRSMAEFSQDNLEQKSIHPDLLLAL